MKTRIGIGLALLVGLLSILWADHRVGSDLGFTFLLCLAVGLGLHEFYTMYEKQAGPMPKRLAVFLGLGLTVSSWILRHSGGAEWVPAMLCLALFVLATVYTVQAHPENALQVIVLGFGLVYVWLPMDFLARLRDVETHGEALVLYLVVTSKLNDAGAYFTGKAIGKRKLSPNVSPGKTVEGSVGGLITGTALGMGVWWAGLGEFISWPGALFTTLAIGVASQLGDLFESYFKRHTGHKDSGSLLPTFGGMLDMIDSFLLCGPLAYILMMALGGRA